MFHKFVRKLILKRAKQNNLGLTKSVKVSFLPCLTPSLAQVKGLRDCQLVGGQVIVVYLFIII